MELPPYRMPMLKSLVIHMWDRSKMFLKKMGGVILIGSVIIWVLSAFPRHVDYATDYANQIENLKTSYARKIDAAPVSMKEQLQAERDTGVSRLRKERQMEKIEKSYMGRIGKVVAPLFEPVGIDWRGSIALMTGFVAKEIVVSTMGVLYAVEAEDADALQAALVASRMTPLSALAMMVFVLFYVPCLATVAAIRRETDSLKWTVFSVVYNTAVAWGMAFVIYQGGKLIGLE
jgi:ferrous iron transport protein B